MDSYNNDSQWAKIKGAFAQTQSRTYNTPQDINFMDGLSMDKKKTMTQTGTTPSMSMNKPWLTQLAGKNGSR